MTATRPDFIAAEEDMVLENEMFCGISVPVYKTVGNPERIAGWKENPRTRMVVDRWRRKHHIAPSVYPDDDVMLGLMLEDDVLSRGSNSLSFDIITLGENIKLNGVQRPLIVTWDGKLAEGNRRKFAVKWDFSSAGGATVQQRLHIERSPIWVLPQGTGEREIQAIVREMNYAPDLKLPYVDVITNALVYEKYKEYYDADPSQSDLEVRRRVVEDFPMFKVTEIAYRVQTWELTQQFRADYSDDLDDDEMDRLVNERFQQFRQAHDTYKSKDYYDKAPFKEVLFEGIRHGLFPSFIAVRKLGAIFESPKSTKIFLEGKGLSKEQKDENFTLAVTEAYRDAVAKRLPVNGRIRECVQFLDGLTSAEIAMIPEELVSDLCESLQTVIAQAEASPDRDEETVAI